MFYFLQPVNYVQKQTVSYYCMDSVGDGLNAGELDAVAASIFLSGELLCRRPARCLHFV